MPIELIDKIAPKNNSNFALVESKDVSLGNTIDQRVDNALCKRINGVKYTKVKAVSKSDYFLMREDYEEDVLYLLYQQQGALKFVGAYYNGIPISRAFWDRGEIDLSMDIPQDILIGKLSSLTVESLSVSLSCPSTMGICAPSLSIEKDTLSAKAVSVQDISAPLSSVENSGVVLYPFSSTSITFVAPHVTKSLHTLSSKNIAPVKVSLPLISSDIVNFRGDRVRPMNAVSHTVQNISVGAHSARISNFVSSTQVVASNFNRTVVADGRELNLLSRVVCSIENELNHASPSLVRVSGSSIYSNNVEMLYAMPSGLRYMSNTTHFIDTSISQSVGKAVSGNSASFVTNNVNLKLWEHWIEIKDNPNGTRDVTIFKSFTMPSAQDGVLDLYW